MTSRRLLRIATAALVAALVGVATPPASALNDPEYSRQYGTQLIGAKAAWDAGLFGSGVEIAVVDSGVHLTHQDLRANVVAGRNYVDPTRPPQDDNEHGTHVAGIAAASIDNGGTVGVAPKAKIIPLKVFGSSGVSAGEMEDKVSAAIRFAADHGAEVINLSLGDLGQSFFGPSTGSAIDYAWSKGSICVFAAGNDFFFGSGFRDEPAIVVSSTGPDDRISSFSNGVGNAKWGLAAPGEDIFSTIWVSDDRTNTYGTLSGTSMSAPLVAGAAALLRGAGLTPQQTVDRLLATAKDLGAKGPDTLYGHGRLDVARAVAGLGSSTGGPPTTSAPATPPQGGATGGGEPAATTTAGRNTSPTTTRRTSAAPTSAPAAEPAPVPLSDTTLPSSPDEPPPVVEPDEGFLEPAGDGPVEQATRSDGGSRDGTDWTWAAIASAAALGVAGAATRLASRRRSVGDPPQ